MHSSAPRLLLGLCFLAFISLGLPDGLLGVAWPSIRTSFGLSLDALGPLLVMFVGGYVGASFASGWLLARMNIGALLALSCLATGISLFGYAAAPSWWVMISFAALAGLGAGAIDAGLNSYVATHYSARALNLLHACYGIGAAGGPLIMTHVLTSGFAWQRGYAIVAAGQVVLAACFAASLRRWPAPTQHAAESPTRSMRATLRLPTVWLGVFAFVVYTGMEAAAGAWLFTLFTASRSVAVATAGTWASCFWGGLMMGRLLFGLLLSRAAVTPLLRLSIVLTGIGAALIASSTDMTLNFAGLVLLGLACGPIFPSLIATTPKRVGAAHSANAVGLQIAGAALGQSLLPTLVGVVAKHAGLESIGVSLFCLSLILLITFEALIRSSGAPSVSAHPIAPLPHYPTAPRPPRH